jgi:hypothetical protein
MDKIITRGEGMDCGTAIPVGAIRAPRPSVQRRSKFA